MKSPTEPTGDFTVIAEPVYDWELVPPYDELKINEGAYFIENAGRLFIVYSANGCWSDDYVLGILEFTGNNMLDAASWTKHDVPLMVKGNGNFGPGHATFFRSPDGSELWIAHHCLHESDPENVAMARHCHCQKVFFDKTGFPYLGTPVPQGVTFQPPSGE